MAAGDHLRVNRGGAVDHAIDVGDRTVIRWRAGAGLERVERALFAPDGAALEVVIYRERVYRPALVVARAFSRFAESAYRAMFQSAEQFAAWCKSAQLPPLAAPAAAPARPATRAAAKKRPAPGKAAPARPARAKAAGARAAKAKPARRSAARKAAGKAARARPARRAAPRKTAAPKGKPARRKGAPRRRR